MSKTEEQEMYDYFDLFEPNRVKPGEVINRNEMKRRIAHALHVPQSYGERLVRAFESVIADAVAHGEGMAIKGAGSIRLDKHTTDEVWVGGKKLPRAMLYKFKWVTSAPGIRFLKELTQLDREGKMNDYFQKAQD